jgi:hypothetical protein
VKEKKLVRFGYLSINPDAVESVEPGYEEYKSGGHCEVWFEIYFRSDRKLTTEKVFMSYNLLDSYIKRSLAVFDGGGSE